MGSDPLFTNGIDLTVFLIVVGKVLVTFTILLLSVLLMIWGERRGHAVIFSNRFGPNRAGPLGILQTLADGLKFFFKENIELEKADRVVFRLAPYLSAVPAFLILGVVPMGGDFMNKRGIVEIAGRQTYLQLADPPIGILFVLACSSLAVYGIMLAGWASGSKYPLLGSVRASAQMVSYEAALGLAVVTVILVSGSLSTHDIVLAQAQGGALFGASFTAWFSGWNLIQTGFVPFVVFTIAATAEMNRPPFDLVEAEQELVGGFNTEYSATRFAMFYLAEFMGVITMSAIIATLFLGGPVGPSLPGPMWLWPPIWFGAKVLGLIVMFIAFRATLPRLRYDQLMDLGWKIMIPLSLGWMLIIAAMRVGQYEGQSRLGVFRSVVPLLVLVIACGFLLGIARRRGEARTLDAGSRAEF